eukprot:TRINITY_DN48553_c0_g1_i1.p1 TRINITY_DN48553_c0_g1~~TRINITY_DN48553_c0_g1_i1.p1  ORF type:complete len:647 (+),score=68.72 TRINITY_DN48553_c0_g1_i1:59-1999(+)
MLACLQWGRPTQGHARQLTSGHSMIDDESTPINRPRGRKTMTIIPRGSVYDYLLFVLPVSKVRYGSLCSTDVRTAAGFFMLTIALQLLLSLVAGRGVILDSDAWRLHLVSAPSLVQYVGEQFTAVPANRSNSSLNPLHLVYESEPISATERPFVPGEMHDDDCVRDNPSEGHFLSMRRPGGGSGGSGSGAGGTGSSAKKAGERDSESPQEYLASPICEFKENRFLCAPPSTSIIEHWDDLDSNHDGVWSADEAKKDVHKLRCNLNVRPSLIYKVVWEFFHAQHTTHILNVAPPVSDDGIPKPYFDIWSGLVGLCIHSDKGMCGTILQSGLFDEALKPGGHPRINDLDSAMQFCVDVLTSGGLCDHALPQTYQLYKARHAQQCGEASYIGGPIYQNPHNADDEMYIAKATYSQVTTVAAATEPTFLLFQCCVILIWMVSTCPEIYDLIVLTQFLLKFPSCDGVNDTGLIVSKEEQDIQILAIVTPHRVIIAVSVFIRLFLVLYILHIGMIFLLSDTDYLNMLLNAVALVFVFEIDELLYNALGRETTQIDIDNTRPIEFECITEKYPKMARLLDKDFWGVVILPIVVVMFVAWQAVFISIPMKDALQCACLQTGDHCKEAETFNKAWYNNYWSTTFRSAVESLRQVQ